ncbi:MAG: undecaprenyl-diphosphate phosphatase [Patescibacteria group bacterium]
MKDFLISIFLGALQGLAEFLPISSSGHLVLFQHLFGLETEKLIFFDLVLHFGTFLSLVFVLNKEFFQKFSSVKNFFSEWTPYFFATLPVIFFGLIVVLFDLKERLFSEKLVPYTFLFTGIVFLSINFLVKIFPFKQKNLKNQIFTAGIFQATGLFPGVSRSGITTVGAILSGLQKKEALKVSFFLFFPAVTLAFVEGALDILQKGFGEMNWINLIAGFLTSFIVGFFSAKVFLKFFEKIGLKFFGIYMVILSIISFLIV